MSSSSLPPAQTASPPCLATPAPPSDFDSFYQATLSPLRRYLASILGSSHEAQDLAHDAYLKTFAAMQNQPVTKPQAFLFTTARRLAQNFRTRRGRRMVPTETAQLEARAGFAPDAAHEAMARQENAALQQAILTLPPGCREVLALRNLDELSHEEIAQRLGISRSGVEKHLSRALRLLRDQLKNPPPAR